MTTTLSPAVTTATPEFLAGISTPTDALYARPEPDAHVDTYEIV